jgi:hypothetical protein
MCFTNLYYILQSKIMLATNEKSERIKLLVVYWIRLYLLRKLASNLT